LDDRQDIWLVKTVATCLKVLCWNVWRKNTEGNQLTQVHLESGKWPFKMDWRCITLITSLVRHGLEDIMYKAKASGLQGQGQWP